MPLHVADHPLIRHKLGILRRLDTSTNKFRDLTREITNLLTYEAFRNLDMSTKTITTWAGELEVEAISGKKVAVVPILRAGMGMLQGVLDLIPAARVNVVGLYRNEETLEPVHYYEKLSTDISERMAVIIDPMLATGNSLIATIELLKKSDCNDIRVVCMVAAPEGIAKLGETHPEIEIFTAALDEKLNEDGYIIPGLGDAGDRIFGTK
jgi:uracil phosphoribosyltransferase